MTKKLFIFDLDGVLVDACNWHRDALNQALFEVSGYEISEKDHKQTFNGIPTKVKLSILSNMGIIKPQDHKKINDLKQEKTVEIIKQKAYIRQEKVDLMDYIIQNDHHLACYTNSIRRTAILMLKRTGVLNKFDYILTNQDVKLPKPNPEGYLFLIKKFDIAKNKCYIIEDSPKGLQAAHQSGANVIKVKNPDYVNLNNQDIKRHI